MAPPSAPDPDATYTLEDLGVRSFPGVSLAVLGHPVGHSISPPMHNAALAEMAAADPRFGDWTYYKFDVAPEALPAALTTLHAAGFHGLNLTIPHKVDAVGLVAEADPVAARMGAVNTLLRGPAGWSGYNSDGFGLEQALREELGAEIAGAEVILLGAGGAARAAAVQCLESGCQRLWIGNRNPARLEALLDVLRGHPAAPTAAVLGFDLANPPGELALLPTTGSAILVNATSLGLRADDPPPIDPGRLPPGTRVFDMIYNPAETALLRAAREGGLAAANGLAMLVWQGARSLQIWSGATVPDRAMMAAARKALGPA